MKRGKRDAATLEYREFTRKYRLNTSEAARLFRLTQATAYNYEIGIHPPSGACLRAISFFERMPDIEKETELLAVRRRKTRT